MSTKHVKHFEVDAAFEDVFTAVSEMDGSLLSRKCQCEPKKEWGVIDLRHTGFLHWYCLTILVERVKHGVHLEVISMYQQVLGFHHRQNVMNVKRYLNSQGFSVIEVDNDK